MDDVCQTWQHWQLSFYWFGTSPTSAFLIIWQGKAFGNILWMGFPQTTGLSVSLNLYLGQLLETFHWMSVSFWTGYFVSSVCSCQELNVLFVIKRLRLINDHELLVNCHRQLWWTWSESQRGSEIVTSRHRKVLGHLLKHHRSRFAKLKLTCEMSDISFFDVFYGQFTIAVGHKLSYTHSCLFLNFTGNFFTVTLNYQLSCIKKVLAILSHSLSSFITGFVTSYPPLFHLPSKIF